MSDPYTCEINLLSALDWQRSSADIVQQFGRFPHRNAILGRQNSPEEDEYLTGDIVETESVDS